MKLKAINPNQYGSGDLDWTITGAEDHKTRKYFRDALDLVVQVDSLKGRRVLDIGCGVGQLFNWLKEKGVREIVGFDPSVQNIEYAKQRYTWVKVIRATLEEFIPEDEEKFDVAFAVMVFEHIQDLRGAFEKINYLLKNRGSFYLITGDKDFHVVNDNKIRSGNFVSVEILNDLGDGQVETETIRREEDGSLSKMYDIFRPIEKTINEGEAAGFNVILHKPLYSSKPKPVENPYAICHLFEFKKI